jgi:hypothetical protein
MWFLERDHKSASLWRLAIATFFTSVSALFGSQFNHLTQLSSSMALLEWPIRIFSAILPNRMLSHQQHDPVHRYNYAAKTSRIAGQN